MKKTAAQALIVSMLFNMSAQAAWLQEGDGSWYFQDSQGNSQKGWFSTDANTWYHFDETGKMQTGWLTDQDGSRYYCCGQAFL